MSQLWRDMSQSSTLEQSATEGGESARLPQADAGCGARKPAQLARSSSLLKEDDFRAQLGEQVVDADGNTWNVHNSSSIISRMSLPSNDSEGLGLMPELPQELQFVPCDGWV